MVVKLPHFALLMIAAVGASCARALSSQRTGPEMPPQVTPQRGSSHYQKGVQVSLQSSLDSVRVFRERFGELTDKMGQYCQWDMDCSQRFLRGFSALAMCHKEGTEPLEHQGDLLHGTDYLEVINFQLRVGREVLQSCFQEVAKAAEQSSDPALFAGADLFYRASHQIKSQNQRAIFFATSDCEGNLQCLADFAEGYKAHSECEEEGFRKLKQKGQPEESSEYLDAVSRIAEDCVGAVTRSTF